VPSTTSNSTKTPKAMWKLPLRPDPNAPENEWFPEIDVVLQLTDIDDSYARNGGPFNGIWATTNTSLVHQYGNAPPANLILYPPGVPPPSSQEKMTRLCQEANGHCQRDAIKLNGHH